MRSRKKLSEISRRILTNIIMIFSLMITASINYQKVSADDQNTIPIAMSLDDNYTYPTIVAMTSILENAKEETKYDFYMLVPGEFRKSNREKIMKLKDRYKNCEINIINMRKKFKELNSDYRITTPAYYRLALPMILPKQVEKIIYLDGDTIVTEDLTAMFNINMSKYYIAAIPDYRHLYLSMFLRDTTKEICSGVMLMNIGKMRKDKFNRKVSDFIRNNRYRLYMHDQTVLNVVCYGHIKMLPLKYGILRSMMCKPNRAYATSNLRYHYSLAEIKKTKKNHAIIHYTGRKPWVVKKLRAGNVWWKYAKKCYLWNEIKAKYKYY